MLQVLVFWGVEYDQALRPSSGPVVSSAFPIVALVRVWPLSRLPLLRPRSGNGASGWISGISSCRD